MTVRHAAGQVRVASGAAGPRTARPTAARTMFDQLAGRPGLAEPLQDGGALGGHDDRGQHQGPQVGLVRPGAPGDGRGQGPLARRGGLQVLPVQVGLGADHGPELRQPARGKVVRFSRLVQVRHRGHESVGQQLARRTSGQVLRHPRPAQCRRPDDGRFLTGEVVVERPGRDPGRRRDLRNSHVGQPVRLGQLERGQRQVEAGLLLLHVPAPEGRGLGCGRGGCHVATVRQILRDAQGLLFTQYFLIGQGPAVIAMAGSHQAGTATSRKLSCGRTSAPPASRPVPLAAAGHRRSGRTPVEWECGADLS